VHQSDKTGLRSGEKDRPYLTLPQLILEHDEFLSLSNLKLCYFALKSLKQGNKKLEKKTFIYKIASQQTLLISYMTYYYCKRIIQPMNV
jgi:hypothetical protein